MTIQQIILLACIVLSLYLGFRLLHLDMYKRLNQTFFVLSLIYAWMGFCDFEMAQTGVLTTAEFFKTIQGVWPLGIAAGTLCLYLFSGLSGRLSRKWHWGFLLFLTIPALFLTIVELGSFNVIDELIYLENIGWATINSKNPNAISIFSQSWAAFTLLTNPILTYIAYTNQIHSKKKRLTLYVFVFDAFIVLGAIINSIILPNLGKATPVSITFMSTMALTVYGYMFSNFKLFEVNPQLAIDSIVKSMSNIMILTDNELHVQDVNQATIDLLKESADELIAKDIVGLFSFKEEDEIRKQIMNLKDVKSVLKKEVSVFRSQKEFVLLMIITPIFYRNAISGYSFIGTDLTAYKEAEKQIQKYTQDLQHSNQELERFAYIASHDLKEPLRTVSSFMTLLERKLQHQLDDESKEFIGYATDGAKRMHELIEAVLSYSKIDKNPIQKKPVDLNKLMTIVTTNLKDIIQQKNAKIIYNDLPIIYAERVHIQRLLQNLVENGLKYNDASNPQVKITYFKTKEYFEFAVIDNGIGVQEEYQYKIFEMFKRLHNSSVYKGTGIGLAICKKIILRHQGEIWLDTTLRKEKGAVFRFRIPIVQQTMSN